MMMKSGLHEVELHADSKSVDVNSNGFTDWAVSMYPKQLVVSALPQKQVAA